MERYEPKETPVIKCFICGTAHEVVMEGGVIYARPCETCLAAAIKKERSALSCSSCGYLGLTRKRCMKDCHPLDNTDGTCPNWIAF